MAGYYGYSMSNNALDAYSGGEKPLSKWAKKEIIEQYKEICEENEIKCFDLSKVHVKVLKEMLLKRTSWHHTSIMYNQTDFYSISYKVCEELTSEIVKEWTEIKPIKEEKIQSIEKWQVNYLTWSGTRKHPKATEHSEIVDYDTSKNYVMTKNGKKMISANGFQFVEKIK